MSSLGSVNLLPHAHRPQRVERGGPAVILIGAMVCLLAMTVAYVVVSNQVKDRQAEVDTARQQSEARLAGAQAVSARQTEVSNRGKDIEAVRKIATNRFAWERLMRELAVVMPAGAWLTEMSASEERAEEAGTTLSLSGCTPDQPAVAEVMDGAKRLNGATAVDLVETSAASNSATDESCGPGRVRFQIQVSFGLPDQAAVEGGSQ